MKNPLSGNVSTRLRMYCTLHCYSNLGVIYAKGLWYLNKVICIISGGTIIFLWGVGQFSGHDNLFFTFHLFWVGNSLCITFLKSKLKWKALTRIFSHGSLARISFQEFLLALCRNIFWPKLPSLTQPQKIMACPLFIYI